MVVGDKVVDHYMTVLTRVSNNNLVVQGPVRLKSPGLGPALPGSDDERRLRFGFK